MFLTAAATDGNLGAVGRTGMHVVLHVIGTRCVGVSTPLGLWITHEPTGADRSDALFSRRDHPHFRQVFARRCRALRRCTSFWRGRRVAASARVFPAASSWACTTCWSDSRDCLEASRGAWLDVRAALRRRFRRAFRARCVGRISIGRSGVRALEGSSRSRAWRCSAARSGARRRPGRSRNGGGARRAGIWHARASGGREAGERWSRGARSGASRAGACDGRRGR